MGDDIQIPVVPLRARIGFAAMDPKVRIALTKKGNAALRAAGKNYVFDSVSGAAAGKKGGQRMAERGNFLREIARLGGLKTQYLRRMKSAARKKRRANKKGSKA